MRISTDAILAALSGGLGGLSRGLEAEDEKRRFNEERDYRRQRDEIGDQRDLTRIHADVQKAAMGASAEADRVMREERDRRIAGGALRSGIRANRDIPEGIRAHFESLSDQDAGVLDPAAVSRLFMDPYTKPAAAQDLEFLRQGGRQSLADINNATREAIAQINQGSQERRFRDAEAGRNQRFEDGLKARQESQARADSVRAVRDSTNNAARAQRDSARGSSSYEDLIEQFGATRATGNVPPKTDKPTRLPPVEVRPPSTEAKPDATKDQKRKDLEAAIRALRSKGTPKKDWPQAVIRAMNELGVR